MSFLMGEQKKVRFANSLYSEDMVKVPDSCLSCLNFISEAVIVKEVFKILA